MAKIKKVITVRYTVEVEQNLTNQEMENHARTEIELAYAIPYGPELDVEVIVADAKKEEAAKAAQEI